MNRGMMAKNPSKFKEKVYLAIESTLMGVFFGMAAIGVFSFVEIIRPLIYSFK
jgi:hypothetical protein